MGSIDKENAASQLSLEQCASLLSGQDFWRTRPNESLGIGSLKFSDGPNGVRGEDWINGAPSAAIPCATALGASFDTELVLQLAKILARECKRKDVHGLLAPTMNIHRYPLCGRNFESFSEDPLLSGLVAASFVKGLQAQGIATSPKHFLANEAENGRRWSDSVIDERAMREIYLEPFRIVVERADPWCIMTAYNSVNGSFCSESKSLLSILRDDWRYKGAVISDWFGTYSTVEAFAAGLDIEMPGPTKFRNTDRVLECLERGEIEKHQIKDSATRVLGLLEKTGRIGQPGFPPPSKAEEQEYLDDPKARALIREASESSVVLLKNESNCLPLGDCRTKLAVFGHHATQPSLFGGGSASLKVPYSSTPWEAIQNAYCNSLLGPGVATERLVPLPNESGLELGKITLEWYNGDTISENAQFFSESLEDTLYMLVEHAPEGLIDPSNFCTSMKFEVTTQQNGLFNLSLCGPGNAKCLVNDEVVLHVQRGLDVSTEDFLFDRSKLEISRREPLQLHAGQRYNFEVVSWSSSHQAQNVNREFFIQGCRLGLSPARDDDSSMLAAERLAKIIDTAIVVVGTGTEWESEGFDRVSMRLPRRQDELILRVAKACRGPTIVVVNAGSPIDMSGWIDLVDAVIYAWFPGMEFGNALANLLTGKVSPCGRLPTTFWNKVEDYPAGHVEGLMTADKRIQYREGVFVGYRQESLDQYKPRFGFGHGLTYTTFCCSVQRHTQVSVGDQEIILKLQNTGTSAARETVLLFVEALNPVTTRPRVELRAFAKTHLLEPGSSQDLMFILKPRDFAYWDEIGHLWRVDSGSYKVHVAGSRGVGDWREMEDIIVRIERGWTMA
ncbi:hypothetical protein FLONG3_3002 [Fusarium longipes]|uniref:beta-glucosidase n=1 Tax=Fusarium longipes TaxID=694270 RepID=A0A395T244_9HYPO|nr:hypothetical protein FLONG3_3002 [Fusarium longipes]